MYDHSKWPLNCLTHIQNKEKKNVITNCAFSHENCSKTRLRQTFRQKLRWGLFWLLQRMKQEDMQNFSFLSNIQTKLLSKQSHYIILIYRQTKSIKTNFMLQLVFIYKKNITIMCLYFDINFRWDTAGQERFKSIASSYYRGAHSKISF